MSEREHEGSHEQHLLSSHSTHRRHLVCHEELQQAEKGLQRVQRELQSAAATSAAKVEELKGTALKLATCIRGCISIMGMTSLCNRQGYISFQGQARFFVAHHLGRPGHGWLICAGNDHAAAGRDKTKGAG